MEFEPPLMPARLERRYKRFLADVRFPDGRREVVHCPNTGAMLGCQAAGAPVWLSHSSNPRRRYAWTWELVEALPGVLVGINTLRANRLVREALGRGGIPPLDGYPALRGEPGLPGGGRADFLLSGGGRPDCYVVVKSVTAAVEDVAIFPDAVSLRARRHLQQLAQRVQDGDRAVLLYCVQREDVGRVRPAVEIDPGYAAALAQAVRDGVEVLAWRASITPRDLRLMHPLAVDIVPPADL